MFVKSALLSLTAASLLTAQSGATTAETQLRPADWAPNATSNLSFEPVGPGDLISVYVAGYESITHSYRVSLSGTIDLVVAKQPIPVVGLKAEDIARVVSKRLIDEKLLVDPVVSVSVLEYRSRPVNIVGAVNQPTTVQAIGKLTLLDAISKANGLNQQAGPEIIVTRPNLPFMPGYTRRISVKELIGQPDSSLNISLQGGEEIRVPVADKLYIAGNVKNPGAYSMDQAGGLTVLQALALCQGTLSFSQPTAVIYRPVPNSTNRQEINIPLREIIKRRKSDVVLLPNDILYVPDNSGKRNSAAVLDYVAHFGSTAGAGLVWRLP